MIRAGLVWAAILLAPAAQAHDGKVHATEEEAAAHAAPRAAPHAAAEGLPLPFDLGGPFTLTDQHGNKRTEADPGGHLQLLFFGYAQCREICSAALPQMADITSGLAARGIAVTPVLITVDPARDTVDAMAPAMAALSADFVGLTGSGAELAAAYKAFQVESSFVLNDPASGPVYAHGSFIYLLDGNGGFITVLPPILGDDRMIDIIAAHAARQDE